MCFILNTLFDDKICILGYYCYDYNIVQIYFQMIEDSQKSLIELRERLDNAIQAYQRRQKAAASIPSKCATKKHRPLMMLSKDEVTACIQISVSYNLLIDFLDSGILSSTSLALLQGLLIFTDATDEHHPAGLSNTSPIMNSLTLRE